MARFIIKIHSRTGVPLGEIRWVDGRIVVSDTSDPRFIEAVEIMLERGSPLPVREGDEIAHLHINRGMFSTLKNIKEFLEKSFGFKAIVAGADWASDQLHMDFISDENIVREIWLQHMLELQQRASSAMQTIQQDDIVFAWGNATNLVNNRAHSDTYTLAA